MTIVCKTRRWMWSHFSYCALIVVVCNWDTAKLIIVVINWDSVKLIGGIYGSFFWQCQLVWFFGVINGILAWLMLGSPTLHACQLITASLLLITPNLPLITPKTILTGIWQKNEPLIFRLIALGSAGICFAMTTHYVAWYP